MRMDDKERFCGGLREGSATVRQVADRTGLSMDAALKAAKHLQEDDVIKRVGSEVLPAVGGRRHQVIAIYALTEKLGYTALSEAWPMPVASLPDGPARMIKLEIE